MSRRKVAEWVRAIMAGVGEGSIYDVVVVGGGPAGAAAAITLARAQRRVLLVEAASGDTAFKIGEALPPAARPLLQEMDLWESFVAQDHLPSYGNLSAWGSPYLGSTDFIFDPNGNGWHLDRSRFDALLRQKASDAGADVSVGTKLNMKGCEVSGDSWLLSLTRNNSEDAGADVSVGTKLNMKGCEGSGDSWPLSLTSNKFPAEQGSMLEWSTSERKLHSRWLIDATGRRCSVARARGARRYADDALVAFFALFSPPEISPAEDSQPTDGDSQRTDQDSRTLIEAAPDGWWYTALLPSRHRVVAYLTDADLAPASLRTKRGYSLLLSRTEHVSACLDTHDYELRTTVKTTSANSARLGCSTGRSWIAVGDAALSFDPVSSQGILTALFTGIKAGQALAEKLSGKTDAEKLSGDSDPLSNYDKRLAKIYNAYLQNRSAYYGLEQRWATRPFWRRRHYLSHSPNPQTAANKTINM